MRSPPIQEPDLHRQEGLHRLRLDLCSARHVVLTTHVGADGDGVGSEIAVARYLEGHKVRTSIVNPTPFPPMFEFLLKNKAAWTPADEQGRAALADADRILILDTAEPDRLGAVARHLEGKQVLVLDHHPPIGPPIGTPAVRDASACATGELVYDLITADGGVLTPEQAAGIYVAIVTDTGSFRFSNTSPRTHEITAQLLRTGVDPEEMYRRLFGQGTVIRLQLLQRAVSALHVDPDFHVAWVQLTRDDVRETGASGEDMEGIVEYPRQLEGIEVAWLIRELPDGKSKVSLRSNGSVSVGAIARDLGGGGHEKAAGVLLGNDLESAAALVLERVRHAVESSGRRAAP